MHYVPSTFYFLSIRVCQAIFSYTGNEEFNFEIMQKKCLSPKLSSVKIPMKYKDCLPPEISFDIHSFSYPRFDNSSFLPVRTASKQVIDSFQETFLGCLSDPLTYSYTTYVDTQSHHLSYLNTCHLSHPAKRNTKFGHENVEERARGSKNVPIQICQPFLNRLVMCIECAALSEIKHYSYI